MKRWTSVIVCVIALVACSPKSKIIPTDSSKWDTLAGDIKHLNEEDRRLLAGYMARQAIGSALSTGKATVPAGTSIGKAIGDQKKFEAEQKKAEAEAEIVRAKAIAQRAAAEKAMNDAAVVSLASLHVIPENIYAGRYNDSLGFLIAVQNKGTKDITGIKGRVEFQDVFGVTIKQMGMPLSETIPAGQLKSFSTYSYDLNQFEADDNRLKTTDPTKIKVIFHPEMIVYADGTKLSAPDAAE